MRALFLLSMMLASTVGGQPITRTFGTFGCNAGPVRAPSGPFAVWVFCEDALGTHIGVVYADPVSAPREGGWGITDRFWQQRIWASDVISFAWSEDGERLFVSTGSVYGSSTLFQLDLRERKAYKLTAEAPGHLVEILEVKPATIRYRMINEDTDESTEGRAVVAFQELWTPLFQKHSPLGSVA